MPFNGSGTFIRNFNWVNDKNSAIPITASRMDSDSNDFVSGFNNALTRDGQGPPTALLPMASFHHTNVADAVSLTDYPSAKQVQQSRLIFAGAGGTGDALTVSFGPAPTLVDGMQILVRAPGANSVGAPTIAVNGGAALQITKLGGTTLAAGDIANGLHELELRYNAAHTRWELLNPAPAAPVSLAGAGIWRGTFQAPWDWRQGKRQGAAQVQSQAPLSDNNATGQCVIKGNINAKGERIYHVPGGQYYDATVIDTAKGERWFCTEAEAVAAGWRKSKR
jgi:hypothetical protein